jgi:hypothetical protein
VYGSVGLHVAEWERAVGNKAQREVGA